MMGKVYGVFNDCNVRSDVDDRIFDKGLIGLFETKEKAVEFIKNFQVNIDEVVISSIYDIENGIWYDGYYETVPIVGIIYLKELEVK